MKVLLLPLALLALSGALVEASGQQPGAVEGTLSLRLGAPRKWATRYPGGGATAAAVQPVPAVVYLEGELPAPGGASAAVSISQEGERFVPGAVGVSTGATVRFPNADPFYHNVFSYSGPRFDLGRYPPGESREIVFDEPGIVRVYCEIHEFMRAVVVVTDHGFHAVVEEDGTFRIPAVPPGSYTLVAFHPDGGTLQTSVSVTAGGTARVALELGE